MSCTLIKPIYDKQIASTKRYIPKQITRRLTSQLHEHSVNVNELVTSGQS